MRYAVVNEERDYSFWEKNYNFVRTDKNGSRIYETCRCEKCGGSGIIPYFNFHDGGVCYECGGSGSSKLKTITVRTPEYQAKLDANKKKRDLAKLPAFCEKWGCDSEGYAYFVLGNTFEIKNDLKEAGARFNPYFKGWYFNTAEVDYPTYGAKVINFSDEYNCIQNWLNGINEDLVNEFINLNQQMERAAVPETEWYGEIGDKIMLDITLKSRHAFANLYGISHLYIFEDADGHIFKWTTAIDLNKDVDDTFTIAGTVKDHTEYKYKKQTVLTRCKLK